MNSRKQPAPLRIARDPQIAAALKQGDIPRALQRFHSISRNKGVTSADLSWMADLLWRDYRFGDAEELFDRLAPKMPIVHLLEIARRWFTLGHFATAEKWLRRGLKHHPANPDCLTALAELLIRCDKQSEGLEIARQAVTSDATHGPAARVYGHALRALGRTEDAAGWLARYWNGHAGADSWRAGYELAYCLDRLDRPEAAMNVLLDAKRLLAPVAADWMTHWQVRRRRRQELIMAIDAGMLRRWQTDIDDPGRLAILAGHPRSGTTLLERMLGSHPAVLTTDETGILRNEFIAPVVFDAPDTRTALNEIEGFSPEDLGTGREFYFRATEAVTGQPIDGRTLMEKDPLATLDLPFMLRLLPEAAVIFPLRHPLDVCVSAFFTLAPVALEGASGGTLEATAAHLADTLSCWRRLRDILPQAWCEVRYEALVTAPEPTLRPVFQSLNLDWKPEVLSFHQRRSERAVLTPSHADVTRPLHGKSIGRWQRYERWLAPHFDILRTLAAEFDYEIP